MTVTLRCRGWPMTEGAEPSVPPENEGWKRETLKRQTGCKKGHVIRQSDPLVAKMHQTSITGAVRWAGRDLPR